MQRAREFGIFRTAFLPKYDSVFENYRMVLVRENYRGEKVSQIGTGRLTGGRNLYFRVNFYFIRVVSCSFLFSNLNCVSGMRTEYFYNGKARLRTDEYF